MNELQYFTHEEFGQVRGMIINDEPWIVGKDITETLGYQNGSKALHDHVDCEDKLYNKTLLSLGQRGGWLINESGLYSLIFNSKLSTAKKFKKWVTSDVLPSIRKNGLYATNELLDNPDLLIKVANKLREERKARVKAERDIKRLIHQPKVFTTSEIAKELNLKSAIELNKILCDKKIQFKQNGTWLLYSRYSNEGYTSIKQDVKNSNNISYNRKWTGKGRNFILKLFNDL